MPSKGWPTKKDYLVMRGAVGHNPTHAQPGGGQQKVETVMHEYKKGTLRSGSKHGPKVKSRKQAVAIAMSEAGLSRRKKGY